MENRLVPVVKAVRCCSCGPSKFMSSWQNDCSIGFTVQSKKLPSGNELWSHSEVTFKLCINITLG